MSDQQKIQELETENAVLKHKLAIASAWMDKEVKASVHSIAKRKLVRIMRQNWQVSSKTLVR